MTLGMKTNTEIAFREDGQGNLILADRTYQGCRFADLTFAPSEGTIVVRNTRFISCSTHPGTCVIAEGVALDRVVFDNFDCGEALRISSLVKFDRVVVKGGMPRALRIQPEPGETANPAAAAKVPFQLDISNFAGDVLVAGLRTELIRRNPARHAVLESRWCDDVPWRELKSPTTSFWKLGAMHLREIKVEQGIFSLPDPSDRYYEQVMREKERLQQAGVSIQ